MVTTVEELRGLVLSATEVRNMTGWPSAMIEDYLTIIENLITVSQSVDTKQPLTNAKRVISPVYNILDSDDVLFFDTDSNPITANLPAGSSGTTYRLINCGQSANDLTITPNGAELLNGFNSPESLIDSENLLLTYEITEGWY